MQARATGLVAETRRQPVAAYRHDMSPVRRYLLRLDRTRIVLWCYLLWYLVIVARYFDPTPRLWLTSLGLAAIIGIALLLNAGWGRGPLDRWQAFRFFLMPFCVSSFSALVKGRGFVLVFSPVTAEVMAGLAACAVFLAMVWAVRRAAGRGPKVQ
jgi:hypothetical protein